MRRHAFHPLAEAGESRLSPTAIVALSPSAEIATLAATIDDPLPDPQPDPGTYPGTPPPPTSGPVGPGTK